MKEINDKRTKISENLQLQLNELNKYCNHNTMYSGTTSRTRI